MSLVVVIVPHGDEPTSIASATAHELLRLGVTDVTLADGPAGSAVVLAGWAFDGRRHQQHVLDLVAPGGSASVLHGVADMTLRPEPDQDTALPA
ncbi:MAG: hypothetical protein ABR520_07155 [Mycobacteriales bacterium]|nr:hypothetical protein [Frankia sp.]